MAFNRLKGLAKRVKRRVVGRSAVGDQFGPEHDRAFALLDDNADASFQLIGASMVGTWEVLLTDLSRAMQGGLPDAEARKLVERVSDAFVPTQEPMQSASRVFRKALKQGVQQALQSGQLSDATRPISASLQPLPEKMGQGWVKTVEYLQPVLLALKADGSLSSDFVQRHEELVSVLAGHNAAYTERMVAMPQARDLNEALAASLDTWREAVAREMELFLYARRTAMVEAARSLPR
jgi:hypothetical protein